MLVDNAYLHASLQDSRHPADDGFEAQLMWTVYGMSIASTPGSLAGYLNTYHFSLTIRNTGVDPLTGLVIQVRPYLNVTGRWLQNSMGGIKMSGKKYPVIMHEILVLIGLCMFNNGIG